MDSEEEQQCFAEHVACLDAPNGIVLFLVPEAALYVKVQIIYYTDKQLVRYLLNIPKYALN